MTQTQTVGISWAKGQDTDDTLELKERFSKVHQSSGFEGTCLADFISCQNKHAVGGLALGIAAKPVQDTPVQAMATLGRRLMSFLRPEQRSEALRLRAGCSTSVGWDHTHARWQYPVSPFLGPDLRTLKNGDKMASWELTWSNGQSQPVTSVHAGTTLADAKGKGKAREESSA